MENWFKEWFSSEEYLDVYQHRNDDDAAKFLELILDQCNLSFDNSVLDAACGAGRHSILLASKGYNVVGFDLSKTLLLKAKETAKLKLTKTNFVRADLRNVWFNKKFDLVLNLFTSFGYFDNDEENFEFIRTAYSLLNKNGIYVLDYFNKNYLVNNLTSESERNLNGKKIIERRKIVNNRIIKEILIADKNKENRFVESVRLYSKNEIISEFSRIGFNLIKTFGDYEGNSFDENTSTRIILFFQK